MKARLEQVSSGLVVPDTAVDLSALQDVIDNCKPDDNPPPSSPINVTIKLVHKAKIEESRLDKIDLSDAKIRLTLPKNMMQRQRDQTVAKAQGLASFMLQHGIADDVVRFVLGVRKLVPSNYPINWKLWLCVPRTARRPPLWW